MSESDIIDLRAQSHALEAMLQEAEGIASVTGAVEVGSEPVSYTHLDVYKRQSLHHGRQQNS